MDILFLPYQEFRSFFLIMVRVSVILFMFPFFSAKVIPLLCKAGLAFIISIILLPVVGSGMPAFPATVWELAQMILGEFAIGVILGLLVQLFFEGVRMMGQLVGFQTGFAVTNIIDPQNGIQVSIFSNMAYLVAVVLFLLLEGHHILITALKESFEILRVGQVGLNSQIFEKLIPLLGRMFSIAIKIGAPAIAALLFTKVAFGLITKMMPQMNIMIVAFPVQIVIGLVFFGISLNVLLGVMANYLEGLGPLLLQTMNWMKV